jgi:hypothetical protein
MESDKEELLNSFQENPVNVAIAPFLARLERFDDRMLRRVEMLGRVFVL